MSAGHPLFVSGIEMSEADNYNDWTFSLFAPYLRGRVLEVGCGVGSFTRRIVARGGFDSLLSIDVAAEAVAHTAKHIRHPALSCRQQDVRETTGKFDAIICMNVLEHMATFAAAFNLPGPGKSIINPGISVITMSAMSVSTVNLGSGSERSTVMRWTEAAQS